MVVPKTTGYGTSVIRDLIPYELDGAVDYELGREGARCRVEIPAKWLSQGSAQSPPDAVEQSVVSAAEPGRTS